MNEFPKITLNDAATLVTIEYSGHITADAMRAHAAEADSLRAKLKPGFIVLSDLTQLDTMDPDCAPLISQLMDQFNRLGIGRLIRVIPDPKKDIGLGILIRFHYKRGLPVNTVTTMAEAQRLL